MKLLDFGLFASLRRPGVRKLTIAAAVAGALLYIGYTILSDASLSRQSLSKLDWRWALGAILTAAPMYLFKGCYQLMLLDRSGRGWRSWRNGLRIYLQAQLVRYLPGKIWGLLYQASRMSGSYGIREVMLANFWQMLTTNFLAAGLITSILLGSILSPWCLGIVLPFILAVECAHRNPQIEGTALRALGSIVRRELWDETLTPLTPYKWKLTSILCLEWVFYFLTIWMIFHGWNQTSNWLLVGAWYSGASILALLAFVVPAGVAVREAIFVMGPEIVRMDAASMAIFAIVARIVFLFAELATALVATLIRPDSFNQ